MEQKRKTIEWHPAFTASLQIEFEDEADKIIFESEHLLSKEKWMEQKRKKSG